MTLDRDASPPYPHDDADMKSLSCSRHWAPFELELIVQDLVAEHRYRLTWMLSWVLSGLYVPTNVPFSMLTEASEPACRVLVLVLRQVADLDRELPSVCCEKA